jgi:hypothetical protein
LAAARSTITADERRTFAPIITAPSEAMSRDRSLRPTIGTTDLDL